MPERLPLSAAWPKCEVLPIISGTDQDGKRLPARSPNLNSYAERWVRSVKEECLSRLILVGESSLRRALQQYTVHYHEERQPSGQRQSDLVSFGVGGKKEHRSSAVSRTTGRPAGVLRKGSGIKARRDSGRWGSLSAHILRMPGISTCKSAAGPDLSATCAGQWFLAQGSDQDNFFHHSVLQKHTEKEFIMN